GVSTEELFQTYDLSNTGDWSLEKTINAPNAVFDENLIKIYLYRPFDLRFLYYERKYWVNRPRYHIMKHLEESNLKNLALLVGRAGRVTRREEWDLVFVSQGLTDLNIFYRGGVTIYPVFLKNGKSNIKSEIIASLQAHYKSKISPMDIFYYIYAILFSLTYRKKYSTWLKFEPPRIPFPQFSDLFFLIRDKGETLVKIHLGKKVENQDLKIKTSSKVEKITYDSTTNRLWINSEYNFLIPEEVWKFHIGGYAVLKKWLKDRKNKTLTIKEISWFRQIIQALKKTIQIQKDLDSLNWKFLDSNYMTILSEK
ncbi:MAG: type ISP restriction/modification enzyme, partial [Candidatus Hodarchaeota archaeon]